MAPPAVAEPSQPAISLPHYPPFPVASDRGTAGPRWEKWIARLDNLFLGLSITDAKRQRALLLHYAGEEVYDIFDAMPTDDKGEAADYDKAKKCLTDYFAPAKNTEYEMYKFRQATQRQGETIDEYYMRLRKLADTCGFGNRIDAELKTQLIATCTSSRLRRRALRGELATLIDFLKAGRAMELSEMHCSGMENATNADRDAKPTVNKMAPKRGGHYGYRGQRRQRPPASNDAKPARQHKSQCRNCGGEWPHTGDCPAKGKQCRACTKYHHFEKMCRSKGKPKIRQVRTALQPDSSSDDEYVFGVHPRAGKSPNATVKVQDTDIRFMIDT